MKRIFVHKVALFCVVAAFYACGGAGEKGEAENATGETIIETGFLVAVNSQSFIMPRLGRWSSLKITGLIEHGTVVSEGDSVLQLDPTDILKYISDQEADLDAQLGALEKLKLNQANSRSSREATRKSQLASFELKKMEYEASRFESERTRRIKELEFQQAEIDLKKQMRKIELSRIIDDIDLKRQQVRIERTKEEIAETTALLDQLTFRTPIPGVFQIEYNRRNRSLVKVGDQVYSGNRIGVVPDLRWMKVETFVNEIDYLKLHVGQKVAVRLDAMNDVVFDGEVSYLGKLCRQKPGSDLKQMVFDVEVKLLVSDERLKPGMTVSCEFL